MKVYQKSSKPQSMQQGFTLLEVLLAFVVFAISFAVTLEILTGAIRNTARARQYTESALIAQSVMDQIGMDIPLRSGTSFQGEEGEYSWEVSIQAFQGSGGNDRSMELISLTGVELLEVECTVSWGTGSRQRSEYFSTVKAVVEEATDLGP